MALSRPRYPSLTNPVRLPGGYQTGDVNEIARKYSPTPQALSANQDDQLTQRSAGFASLLFSPPPRLPTRAPTGATGDTGSAGVEPNFPASHEGEHLPQRPPPAEGVAPPAQNARQRWMAEGGTAHTYNQANVERGIRPKIDARAAPDPKGSTASADIRAKWGWNRNSSMELPY